MPQHRTFLVLVVFVAVLSMASCGSSRPATSPSRAQNATEHAEPARATPSAAAKMVCAREAQNELAAVIGVRTTQPVVPTWSDHIYSCRYTYHKAVMVLSVKELSSKAETDAYFTSLKHRLGQAQDLGESAFTTKNRSLVVRKDYKVLLVDISGLPGRFGDPLSSRGKIAIRVGATIMNCWTGD
jgi:hypothetical protein